MKNSLCVSAAFMVTGLLAGKPDGLPSSFKINEEKAICFTENKGQVHNQFNQSRQDVLFGGGVNGMNFHLTKNGVSYQLSRVDAWEKVKLKNSDLEVEKIDKATVYRLDLNWLNTNSGVIVKGSDQLNCVSNYVLDNNNIITAKSYGQVMYSNLYNGIDLKWYEKNGELEYDYIVAPGADYSQIRFEVKGAGKLHLNAKHELVLETPLGIIIQKAPVAIQNGKILKASWKIQDNTVCFDVKNVDPSQTLVIDPVVRAWGTYYGGSGNDRGWSCAADANGNVYLAGDSNTPTSTLIATSGSHQSSFGGAMDLFLAKFNAAGVRQWATYYGGTSNEFEPICAVDNSGNVYIASYTGSNTGTVIATVGSHQATFGGGVNDAFLVKFDANGVRQWGTYYGGTGAEYARGLTTDASGNVYMTGFTSSTNSVAIATSGAHQVAHGGGTDDGFLVKFNSSGVRQWGTYYGGTFGDRAFGVAVDGAGNVYLSGDAYSTNGISTLGSHQVNNAGGFDGFLCKFNSTGVRQWATYYGGTGDELDGVCAVDAGGNVYLFGYTGSGTGTAIATPGSHQPTLGGGYDSFLVKFNASGVRQWGSYYGGSGSDLAKTVIVDPSGLVYINGITGTTSGTAIATSNGYQLTNNGSNDQFFACFNQSGERFYGSFYGGSGDENSSRSSLSVGGGYIFMAGLTNTPSSTTIATPGAHQTTSGGSNDAFLAKFYNEGEAINLVSTSPGDKIVLPAAISSSLSTNNKITVEAWVRPTSLSGLGIIIGSYSTPNNQMQFMLRRESINYRFWVGNGSGGNYTSAASATTPTLNVWQHVAGVWNGTVASIYINGVLSGTASITYPVFGTTTNSLIIGGNNINENFNGDVDEIRIWNRPLCISEIQNNMNAELTLPQNGLMAYYKFNQGIAAASNATVTTLTDDSPNVYTGTLTGVALNGYTSNWIAPGGVLKGSSAPAFVSPTVAITGTTAICQGATATLTANGNVSTYNWVSGPTTASYAVSPSVTTTYSVTGTNSLGCVSNVATQSLVVNSLPTVAVNNGTICSGNSFTITPSGAVTYTIEGGNTVVSPTVSTNYTVVGTSSAGCVSNVTTQSLVVNSLPTVAVNDGTICSGNSFTINPSGASTYTIEGGNTVVSPTVNTSYTVAGTSSAGCVSANTATSNVSVNPNPTVSAITTETNFICVGQSATLTASGASTYVWNTTATTAVIAVSPTVTTSYTVTGTDGNGCEGIATITQSVSPCTGLSSLSSGEQILEIYPNPSSGIFNLKVAAETSIQIFDLLGKSVLKTDLVSGEYKLNLSEYNAGLYIVKCTSHGQVKSYRLIKE